MIPSMPMPTSPRARYQGARVPVARDVDPGTLTKDQLARVIALTDVAGMPPPRVTDYASALARAERGLRRRGWRLARNVPRDCDVALEVSHKVWVTDSPSPGRLDPIRWHRTWRLRVSVSTNPKRRGSASAKRFDLYRDDMRLVEFGEAVGFRRKWLDDITNDWERGYIRVWRDDGTEVVNPLLPPWPDAE